MKICWECGKVTSPMFAGQFFMLGVIHRDKDGPDLLKAWLHRIQPDIITMELSRYGIRFRKELGERFRKRICSIAAEREERGEKNDVGGLAALISYVSMPYEYDVVTGYAAEHKVPYHLIDMDFFSYLKLRAVEDLLSDENIEMMLADTHEPNGNRETALAKLYFEKGVAVTRYDREMYIRDRYMSARIQDLMRKQPFQKFIHICGWQHLQDPSKLYDHLNPIKVFSHDKAIRL